MDRIRWIKMNTNVMNHNSSGQEVEQQDLQNHGYQSESPAIQLILNEDTISDRSEDSEDSDDSDDSSQEDVWSDAGPPAHWALSSNAPTVLKGIKSSSSSAPPTTEHWKSSFANLSRVLQISIFANRDNETTKKRQTRCPYV